MRLSKFNRWTCKNCWTLDKTVTVDIPRSAYNRTLPYCGECGNMLTFVEVVELRKPTTQSLNVTARMMTESKCQRG